MNEAETQRLESIYERKLAALDEFKRSPLHQAVSGELQCGLASRQTLEI